MLIDALASMLSMSLLGIHSIMGVEQAFNWPHSDIILVGALFQPGDHYAIICVFFLGTCLA